MPPIESQQKFHLTKQLAYNMVSLLIIIVLCVAGVHMWKQLDTTNVDLDAQKFTAQLRDQYAPLAFDHNTRRGYFSPNQFLSVDVSSASSWLYKMTSGGNNIDISISDSHVFENPLAVKTKPECINLVEIQAKKRAAKPYERGPVNLPVNKQYGEVLYAYWPKLGVCTSLYSDSFLNDATATALSLNSPY